MIESENMIGAVSDAKRFKENEKIGNYSGLGSTYENTKEIRECLPLIIEEKQIKSICDAPCGDCAWIKHIDLSMVDYVGIDLVDFVLDEAIRNIPKGIFMLADLAKCKIPKVDLIICRDFLYHVSFEIGTKVIQNFKESGSTYLLSSSFWCKKNENISPFGPYEETPGYSFRPINLQLPPYSLGIAEFAFKEFNNARWMGIWRLNHGKR